MDRKGRENSVRLINPEKMGRITQKLVKWHIVQSV